MGFPCDSHGKESACNAGDPGSVPGSGRLEKEMATNSSILAWEIPRTEELVGYSPCGHNRVGRDLATKETKKFNETYICICGLLRYF